MSGVMIYRKTRQNVREALAGRGHHIVYRADETNRCPGCGRAQWYVGRLTAECGFCGTAIALAESKWAGGAAHLTSQRPVAFSDNAGIDEIDWADRRRHERVPVTGRTLQLLLAGSPHSFAVQNLSAGGAMGEAPDGLCAMSAIQVRFEGGILVPATVRWTKGSLVGLAFDAPVLFEVEPNDLSGASVKLGWWP